MSSLFMRQHIRVTGKNRFNLKIRFAMWVGLTYAFFAFPEVVVKYLHEENNVVFRWFSKSQQKNGF